jgi:hypothetical protein
VLQNLLFAGVMITAVRSTAIERTYRSHTECRCSTFQNACSTGQYWKICSLLLTWRVIISAAKQTCVLAVLQNLRKDASFTSVVQVLQVSLTLHVLQNHAAHVLRNHALHVFQNHARQTYRGAHVLQ